MPAALYFTPPYYGQVESLMSQLREEANPNHEPTPKPEVESASLRLIMRARLSATSSYNPWHEHKRELDHEPRGL